MIKIFGEYYYIDFEEIDFFLELSDNDLVVNKETTTTSNPDGTVTKTETDKEYVKSKEINSVRFELIRNFITDLGDEVQDEEEDEMLGNKNLGKTSIRFKLAFNTLLAYRILKKMI